MSENPLVSVILTTKNESKNIKRFLKSIALQTYGHMELIVVDNNSSDKTKEIAWKFTKNVYNYGPERSAQRNFGAKKAGGRYLIFLDADMELSPRVVEDCVKLALKSRLNILTIPETTVGAGFVPRVRKFEREMYIDEPDYEVPRFFDRNIFFEYGGYDENLTGPEDYDLPYRMRLKNKIGRVTEYIYHHEEGLSLAGLLRKKYYYAKRGAFYALKHPRLVKIQGTILFRRVYVKHWRKFVSNPFIGAAFLIVRFLETVWAVAGFVSSVGITGFLKTFMYLFKK